MAFYESTVVAADSGLFTMFTLPLVNGDPQTLLRAPHSVVLSEKMAEKYFGDINPVGKSLQLENRYTLMVTGVMKNIPGNSLLRFDAILPYAFLREFGFINNSWGSNNILTFVHLVKGSDLDSINKKLTGVVKEYLPETETKCVVNPLVARDWYSAFTRR